MAAMSCGWQFRPADGCEGGAGEVLAQDEVQLADLGHGAVQTDLQDVPPQRRREGLVGVRQHARAQAAAAAGDLRDDGVNAVGGRAGHQADEELGAGL